jgi:signal transduction histidine kinase
MAEAPHPGLGVSLVAHDLKNTFHLMTLALEDLQHRVPRDERTAQTFVELRWFLAHVDYLATTLIDGLRADAGERRAIALNDFLIEREPQMARTLTPGVVLVLRPAVMSGSVLAAPTELERLMIALVARACAAMPTGGELTISTGWLNQVAGAAHASIRPRRYVRLTVSDTGDSTDRDPNAELLDIPASSGTQDGAPAQESIAAAVRRLNGWLIVENEDRTGTRIHICLPALPDPVDF